MVAITIVSIWSILHIKTDKVLANESSWNVINVNGKSYRLVE
jgi:hypothetical protein